MASSPKLLPSLLFLQAILTLLHSAPPVSGLFTEYIGAIFTGVKFSDVPINPNTEVHFILSFAIDYTTSSSPTPTNGQFNTFWDTGNLSPSDVAAIKQSHGNVQVAVSLGGDSVQGQPAYFSPTSIDSWVSNAVSSLTEMISNNNLDGIDIDYEHFQTDADTFAEAIGTLITTLKNNGVIKFASIAPFEGVNDHYLALWQKYSSVIDFVNFQFYAYDSSTTVSQFLGYYATQRANYQGGNLLASFATSPNPGGLSPANGFFTACNTLKQEGELFGIFIWAADYTKAGGSQYELEAQSLV